MVKKFIFDYKHINGSLINDLQIIIEVEKNLTLLKNLYIDCVIRHNIRVNHSMISVSDVSLIQP